MELELTPLDDEQAKDAQTTALTVLPPPERAALALGTAKTEAALTAAAAKHKTITVIKDKAGRDQAHGAAMELMRMRTALAAASKTVREDATAFSKAVMVEEARLAAIVAPEETRLKKLRDDWDAEEKKRKEEEARQERERQAAIGQRLDALKSHIALARGARTSAMVQTLIDGFIQQWRATDKVADFAEHATAAEAAYLGTLEAMRAEHKKKADAEAEAQRQREERERLAEQQRKQEAEARRLADLQADLERQRAELEAMRNPQPVAAADAPTESMVAEAVETFEAAAQAFEASTPANPSPAQQALTAIGNAAVAAGRTVAAGIRKPVVVGVDLASGPDTHHEWKFEPPGNAASDSAEKVHPQEAHAVAMGFDAVMKAPLPARAAAPAAGTDDEAPSAQALVDALAKAFNVPEQIAVDWLIVRADEFFNLI